ncbi:hypothetical protein MtrunA17_Chr1g0208481 [Medicago truncatula]|uniref:Uncharacterized protein n=1 Tax=Medicago truncatula TaxID=3880 RepID=A0A396JVF0_MEDTR|nr:hypothetical protein MtrunA17_Chr1g0208481 [Medicago truncatula]
MFANYYCTILLLSHNILSLLYYLTTPNHYFSHLSQHTLALVKQDSFFLHTNIVYSLFCNNVKPLL